MWLLAAYEVMRFGKQHTTHAVMCEAGGCGIIQADE